MLKKISFQGVLCALCLCVTAVLISFAPALMQYIKEEKALTPPGISRPERELITVWTFDEAMNASEWLKKQCAAFSKQHAGVSVWVRTAAKEDIMLMQAEPAAAPDVLVFQAGAEAPVECLRETGSASALSEAYARSGLHEGRQLAVPVALSGYAVAARTKETVTPVPRSLFGVVPTAEPQADAPQEIVWPEVIHAQKGFGAVALMAMDAPAQAALADDVLTGFLSGEMEAAMLSVAQLRKCASQGVGYETVAASPATDLVLYAARTRKSGDTAEALLAFLLSEAAQRELTENALLSVHPQLNGFAANQTALRALSLALSRSELPNAFSWPLQAEAEETVAAALLR